MKHKLLLLSSIGFSAGIITAQKPMNVIYMLADYYKLSYSNFKK